MPAESAVEDGLGGIADGLDRHVGVEEADNAAGAAFEPLVAPWESTDQAALAEHQFDVAAKIFRVQQAFLESPAMERKHVLAHPAARFLVRVFEGAEEIG